MHSKKLRSEHKYGVTKIEYEADNGKVHTFIRKEICHIFSVADASQNLGFGSSLH